MDNLDLNISKIDIESAEAGVWIDYEGEIRFKIARSNTAAYRAAVKKMHRQYKRQIDQETLSEQKSDQLLADLMAEHILLDWEGLMNGGEVFPYSKENARALLKAEAYAELRQWIMMQADDLENFRAEDVKK